MLTLFLYHCHIIGFAIFKINEHMDLGSLLQLFVRFKELRFDLKYESDLRVQQRDTFYFHAT